MSRRFQELDWRETPLGPVSLRRRLDPTTGTEVYEVKLGDEFLMSSMFTRAESALAEIGLARLSDAADLRVVVGGLGLGYTARAVLDDARVGELVVIDALQAVIDWHRAGLVPLGEGLTSDPRCRLVLGDFFEMARGAAGLDGSPGRRRLDAVLVDIDHSPRHLLDTRNADFYGPDGLTRVANHLRPGGVFAMWSNDPPDGDFLGTLATVFADAVAEVVTFDNPLQGRPAHNTVYVGTARRP